MRVSPRRADGSLRDDKFGGGEKGDRGSSRVMHGRGSVVVVDDKWEGRKGRGAHSVILFPVHNLHNTNA